MNLKNQNREDFLDFVDSKKFIPPEPLNQKILNSIYKDLNPSHIFIFSKFILIQAFIGGLTLIFCPQFNLSLTNNFELFHYFHHTYGESLCMAICGAIFIGSGAIFASYILTLSEIRRIKTSKFLYYFLFTSIALLVFLFFGGEVSEVGLKLLSFWFFGGSLAGIFFFEINRFLRLQLFHW